MVRELAGVEVTADQPLREAGLDDVGASGFQIDMDAQCQPGITTAVAHQHET